MEYKKIPDWKKLPELFRLLDLSSQPKELYYLGNWRPEIFKNCTAVVGSRKISQYGRQVIEKIVPQLVFQKQTVVSGFMYGTDQYTHQMCVDNGGVTMAVLGWGVALPLTGYDKKLADEIIENGGLLISEWENQKGTNWTFPVRDRIIAALCQEIIVTEAAARSGALITARDAVKLKREIWAVPGPITSRTSEGTNNLIASGLAKMWLNKTEQAKINFSDPLLDLLSNESLTADEMARKLALPVGEIGTKLTMLSLSGQIGEHGGKYYLKDE